MLSSRLEEKIAQEQQVVSMVTDESRQRQLQLEDDFEDFMDENSVNASGHACPHALKLIACLLLMEITTFLRECYRTLPKPCRAQVRSSHFWGEVAGGRISVVGNAPSVVSGGGGGAAMQSASGRRWSMAAQSLAGGQSLVSGAAAAAAAAQQQRQSGTTSISTPLDNNPSEACALIPASGPTTEQHRKISFVLQDDIQALNSTLQADEDKRGPRITQGKPFLKRGPSQHSQSSFRRRSIRLKKNEERQSSTTSASSATGGGGGGGGNKWASAISGGGSKQQDGDTECKCFHSSSHFNIDISREKVHS